MADNKMTMEELRKMNDKDRAKMLMDLKKDLSKINSLLASGKEKQSHKAKFFKKQIARINTINTSQAHA